VGELDEMRQRSAELRARAERLQWTLDDAARGGSPEVVSAIAGTRALLEDMQRELVKSEHLIFAIFDGALDGFVLTDREHRFVEVNAAAAAIRGVPRERLLGRTGDDFLAPSHDVAQARPRFSDAGQLVGEVPIQRASGEKRTVEYAARANILPGVNFSVVRDVTERRQLEELLQQAQKMDAIGALAGGVAHDFNNALSVIICNAELTLTELRPEDPVRLALDDIRRAGERASELTRQLLAFGRRQVLQPRQVDLNLVVAGIEPVLRRVLGDGVALRVRPSPVPWTVFADRGQVEQVVMNLAVNARDAMPEGGALTIEIANLELDDAYAARHVDVRSGSYVTLAVSDTGVGMDRSIMTRIFEPYFTTKDLGRGSGLGLATVFGIVKQSGGDVRVDSEPGKGTTFRIYLPRSAAVEQADDASPRTQPQPATGGSETILLVEDDEPVRTMTRNLLRRDGYNVLEARNGGEAFLIAESFEFPIHLLLTDVVLPMMSGRQLAQRLLAMRPDLRVLYMSGYTDNAVVHHGVLDAGVAFLEKPFTPGGSLRKVRSVLDAKHP
jgi:PAS domain S-box-containing protein